jgi:hypothetical protein
MNNARLHSTKKAKLDQLICPKTGTVVPLGALPLFSKLRWKVKAISKYNAFSSSGKITQTQILMLVEQCPPTASASVAPSGCRRHELLRYTALLRRLAMEARLAA